MSATRTSLFARLFGRTPKTIRNPQPSNRARLGLTALEARDVPAYLWGGSLVSDGTNFADVVSVGPGPYPWQVKVVENGRASYFNTYDVTTGQLHFRGNGGNDTFTASTSALAIVADGGAGNDTISGGRLGDTLAGGVDHDWLYGQEGNDVIYGNDGNDRVWAGDGYDVFGGWGNDTLAGEAHGDHVYGEGDSDTLYGNDGDDRMWGDNHGNWWWGGEVGDVMYGGAGNDTLAGEGGDDYIRGELGADVLYGNDGHDTMYGDNAGNAWGGEMADQLFGGWGNDTMAGEGGNDYLYGEGDWDVLYGNGGIDWLEAGSAAEPAFGDGVDWNAHVWAVNGTHMSDVDQNASGTCVFLAALAGSANHHYLENNISYEGNHTYAVQLFDPGSNQWVAERVRFDGSMVTNLAGQIVDPISKWGGEFWTIVYQRAYLQRIGIDPYVGEQYDTDDVFNSMGQLVTWGDDGTDDPFDGEADAVRATRAITGLGATVSTDFNLETMRQQLDEGRVVTAGGTGHRYTVLEIVQDDAGTWLVRLRNPWANDLVHAPNTGSTIDFNAEGLDDGVITVTWATFSNPMNFDSYDFSS